MTSRIGLSRSDGEDSTKKEPLSEGGETFEDFFYCGWIFLTEMSPFAICQDEEGKCPQCIATAMDKLGVLSDCREAKNADILRLNWPLSEIVAAASVRLQEPLVRTILEHFRNETSFKLSLFTHCI